MSSSPIIVTRDLVKRGWSDFEPKIVAGGITGSVGAFLVPIAAGFGIHLSTIQANYLCVAIFFLGAYLTPSAGTTVTSSAPPTFGASAATRRETHSGNSVTTVTGATPIQSPAPSFTQTIAPDEPVADAPVADATPAPFWAKPAPVPPLPADGNETVVLR